MLREKSYDFGGRSPALTDLRKCHKKSLLERARCALRGRIWPLCWPKCVQKQVTFHPQQNHGEFNGKEEARPSEDSDRGGAFLGDTASLWKLQKEGNLCIVKLCQMGMLTWPCLKRPLNKMPGLEKQNNYLMMNNKKETITSLIQRYSKTKTKRSNFFEQSTSFCKILPG